MSLPPPGPRLRHVSPSASFCLFFFLMIRRPPRSTLFPYHDALPISPEEWLKEVDTAQRPAVFKLFLGYAPGVGKTYAMLSEGVRRASRGEEVVIGVVETHGRKPIVELSSRLEAVPRKKLEYK